MKYLNEQYQLVVGKDKLEKYSFKCFDKSFRMFAYPNILKMFPENTSGKTLKYHTVCEISKWFIKIFERTF